MRFQLGPDFTTSVEGGSGHRVENQKGFLLGQKGTVGWFIN